MKKSILGLLTSGVFSLSMAHNLVQVKTIIPDVILDIKYATNDNFTKEVVYSSASCYLVEAAACALKSAVDEFSQLGYTIKIWDGYRPLKVQYKFWELVPDPMYVADPKKGSRHNRGCAVDLTLVDKQGKELDMGTAFDDFSERAHQDYANLSVQVLKNRKLLQRVMEKHGFVGWQGEWWHFDYKDWQKYPMLDIDFEEVETKNS